MPEIIGNGAEAIIYKDNEIVVKDRIEKNYRLKEIDLILRKSRTRREAKVLEKLAKIDFPSPKLIDFCDKEMKINMAFIEGEKVRDVIEKTPLKLSREIGGKIGILHSNDVIHGDLTTSNMILNKAIYFLDFGLSFFSAKIEDKAVDLHLLKQALESRHCRVWEKCFKAIIDGYKKTYPDHSLVLKRLEKVSLRGRNKTKNGVQKRNKSKKL